MVPFSEAFGVAGFPLGATTRLYNKDSLSMSTWTVLVFFSSKSKPAKVLNLMVGHPVQIGCRWLKFPRPYFSNYTVSQSHTLV